MHNPSKLSPEWIAQIKAEWTRYQEEEETVTMPLHRRILATWKQDSPKMWRRLQAAGIASKLAFVVQVRMWARQKELLKAGYPVTDAREIAEREELMLEPEESAAEAEENPELNSLS